MSDQQEQSQALSQIGMADDPQSFYRAMRSATRPAEMPDATGAMAPVFTDRRDVQEVLRQPEVFISANTVGVQKLRQMIPLETDPPDHKKYRKILDPLFAPRAMARLEQPVAELANQLIDAFEGQSEIDFADAFSIPLPSQVFLTLFGLPLEDLSMFLEMKDIVIRPHHALGLPYNDPTVRDRQQETVMSIYDYFDQLLDVRSNDPRDDLVTSFLSFEIDGDRLSREEILDISFLFLVAGLDTVTASLDCMFAFLARNPSHRRQIVDDPSIIPAAVEELLRYETPVMGIPRMTDQDTVVNGRPVKKGQMIHVMLGAANTDDEEFGDGDVVRFDRDPNRHMAFGGGIHRCLGSHLARQELRVALREWHKRIPEYSIKPGADIHYTAGIRSIDHFPLVLETWVPQPA